MEYYQSTLEHMGGRFESPAPISFRCILFSLRSVSPLGIGMFPGGTACGCCLDNYLPCPENRPIMGRSTLQRFL
jgi:hypothetical protein